MKAKFWYWCIRNVEEGKILPWWAKLIRTILFPIDTLYYTIDKGRGYQWDRDVWVINKEEYSGRFMNELAKAEKIIIEYNGRQYIAEYNRDCKKEE